MKIKLDVLKQKIEKKNYTITKLQKLAGTKHGTIHNILGGRSLNPSVDTLQKIASALECSIYDLIAEENQDSEIKKDEVVWDIDLYLDCMAYVVNSSQRQRLGINQEKLLNLVDEAYKYSIQAGRSNIDKTFADWLLTKVRHP